MEEGVAMAYGLNIDNFSVASTFSCHDPDKKKANDLDQLTTLMKEKLKVEPLKRKIQILTLTPESWSRKYASEYFEVSEHLIRRARKLKSENGILAIPDKKIGHNIPDFLTALVQDFFQQDEYSRIMPGKKDCVKVKVGPPQQKRLLMCNLHELYIDFKSKYPNFKIGFSKFCSLRPKWCISVGPSGTHCVCVCIHHQNSILLVNAIQWNVTYKDLMSKLVCDTSNNECMIHRCAKCPGFDNLKEFLDEELSEIDEEEEIQFNQWESTDRSQLVTQTASLFEYKELVVSHINQLTSHSYIAKCQTRYLKELKNSLGKNECIILADFAENYQFVIQDEIQSYHWNKQQCTLHPVVIYFKEIFKPNIQHKSFCFLSDDNYHDTCFVYEFQKKIVEYIKEYLVDINKIYYFSDGCSAHYKNYKNFINLCHHKEDFEITAEWVFFATSHGKSPCDGIGGTIKRTTARASLQRPLENQILTVDDMLEFCIANINTIIFYKITKETVSARRQQLKERFETGKTVPGTRSYHHYIPISNFEISFKRTSEHQGVDRFILSKAAMSDAVIVPNLNDFVACKYDSFWWVGMVTEIDITTNDIQMKFMHPHGPSQSFIWPQRDDICWVPLSSLIVVINVPTTRSGRIYNIDVIDYNTITNKF